MNTFVLHLHGSDQYESINGVVSFVGEDATGSFSLWAEHARFMTNLVFGMARFRCNPVDQAWEYLALPGGVLYFSQNNLYLATRRYYRHQDLQKIQDHMQTTLQTEERVLARMRQQLQHMEHEMLQRVHRLSAPARF